MRRLIILACCGLLLFSTALHGGAAEPQLIALMSEESLPPGDVPTATSSPSAAVASPMAAPSQGVVGQVPGAMQAVPSAVPSDTGPIELGTVAARGQISDYSMRDVIARASSPALAASLRVTEQARKELMNDHADKAIHSLSRALSIDPSNSYAYFYLGRAWLQRKNYDQALTFLKRAENGFAQNPDWAGEALSFEGRAQEEKGNPTDALAAYQKALLIEPGNLSARVGVTRLAPPPPPEIQNTSAPDGSLIQQPPQEPAPPPPPAMPPPPSY